MRDGVMRKAFRFLSGSLEAFLFSGYWPLPKKSSHKKAQNAQETQKENSPRNTLNNAKREDTCLSCLASFRVFSGQFY